MAETNQYGSEITRLLESWMDTANKFWQDVESNREETLKWGNVDLHFDSADEQPDEDKYRAYRTWETSAKNFTAFLKIMSAPENQQAMAKSSTIFAEASNNAARESMETLLEFQGKLIESFARVSEHTQSFNPADFNHSAFQSFRELYTTEWQKYLHIPKIGLPRELHEQLSDFVDKSNIFYSYVGELLCLFAQPFEQSNQDLQRKIQAMLEGGEMENDSTKLYNEWIKVLEGNFMQLLQSPEYTSLLNQIIRSLTEYKKVKNDITTVFLKELQIPTNKDMDEVYKDLYLMKKKVRELTDRLEKLENNTKS